MHTYIFSHMQGRLSWRKFRAVESPHMTLGETLTSGGGGGGTNRNMIYTTLETAILLG
jgi:hypothetical protein